MLDAKRKRLEAKGLKIGSTREFLDMTDREDAYIELHLKLAQADLAKAVSSSQSQVTKMEAGSASDSLDLLVRSILAMDASTSDLATIITGSPVRRKAP